MTARHLSAKCLCGAVRLEGDVDQCEVGACHCDICRRWTGGPFIGVGGIKDTVLSGIDSLSVYQSSAWGERGFCKACGSALFWRTRDERDYVFAVGAIEDLGDVTFTSEIFIDSKPSWYEFANDTKKMTGAEVFAAFGAEQGKPNG
ncbi:GFA family protein [Consotaella aegiceratis]|uniref:GFA family protein n=1 Tax=Consotaella aegiceratis TaxID=3097961 RepID=UPI002F423443